MKRILLFALAVCLSACGYKGVGGSFVGDLPKTDATSAIAEDAAAFLADQYAPGHTALYVLTPEKDALNAFSAAFDAALRSKGFTLASGPSNALSVAYTVDSLKDDKGDESAWYLQLRLSDGQAIARSYDASGLPEAGRTSTPLEKGLLHRASDKATEKASQAYDGMTEAVENLL
ncbi:MAG: hypothetical protein IJA79_09005 [Desulfovibrio sp.]|nr:hypothetical protein [Desulfovibrio sp.]